MPTYVYMFIMYHMFTSYIIICIVYNDKDQVKVCGNNIGQNIV
jgi:hypothetical protein